MAETRSMWDRMLAGELYVADDPAVAEASDRAHRLTHRYNTMDPTDHDERRTLLLQLLDSLGAGSELRAPISFDYGFQTSVGARTFVNWGFVCLDVARVTIGDDVQIGPNVQLLTASHPLAAEPRRAKWESASPITIGDNVWLGGGAVVLPGVTVGADTVVGAGAVVTKDLPPGVLALGTPARVVRELERGVAPSPDGP